MPAKNFIIPEKVKKRTFKFPQRIQKHLPSIFILIRQNPIIGTKLKGELSDYYKVRIGDYRLIYKFNAKTSTVEVVKIEHRQGVYR
jgi:mRNA interferase RelE/StbE